MLGLKSNNVSKRCPRCLIWWPSVTIRPHDDVIKWKHFPRYWPFVRGIHQSPLNSPHKGQWRRALIFYLICAWTTVEQTIERPVSWNPLHPLWRHCIVTGMVSHGYQNQMSLFKQKTFSNAFSWKDNFVFWFKLRGSSLFMVQITTVNIGSRNGLMPLSSHGVK